MTLNEILNIVPSTLRDKDIAIYVHDKPSPYKIPIRSVIIDTDATDNAIILVPERKQ